MKVKKLIKSLKELPQDAEVIVMEQGSGDEYKVIEISEPDDYEEYNEIYLII